MQPIPEPLCLLLLLCGNFYPHIMYAFRLTQRTRPLTGLVWKTTSITPLVYSLGHLHLNGQHEHQQRLTTLSTFLGPDNVYIAGAGETSMLVSVWRVSLFWREGGSAYCELSDLTVRLCACALASLYSVLSEYLSFVLVMWNTVFMCLKMEVLEHEDRTNNKQQLSYPKL